jgi:hypothetical protein
MSRSVIYRFSCAGFLTFSAAIFGVQRTSNADVGINDYHPSGTFTLPTDPSGNSVLFNSLSTGQLVTLNESQISVENSVGSGTFTPTGSLPASFSPSFGPTFITAAPGGTQVAAGDGNGDIAVFNPSTPSAATVYPLSANTFDFDAKWFNSNLLAITDSNGVDVLNATTGHVTNIITDIGGASGGIAFDSAGNLYTGDGFYFGGGPSQTGLIKEFSASSWQTALSSATPLDFEATGTDVAQLLSAASLGFDNSGNFFVGGADFFSGTGNFGYNALVSAAAIQSAIASPPTIGLITGSSPSNVLREFDSPAADISNTDSGYWDYNSTTGDLYLSYFDQSQVQIFSVPEPGSITLLTLVGAAVMLRRKRRQEFAPA